MIFVGFGFLVSFFKRFGYSSVGFNFLAAAYVFELALIVQELFVQTMNFSNTKWTIHLGPKKC
jgi:hypothetical protein